MNSAFGLTFSLPIITAILASQPGDLIILENPENDLHPRAQSIIGQLIGRVSSKNVQIIVETHSDHILNGICLAIHKKFITNDFVKFYYFYKNGEEPHTSVESIPISSDGKIDDIHLRNNNISGFFDQFNKDLGEILFS